MLGRGERKKTEKLKNENQGLKKSQSNNNPVKVMVMGGRGVGSIGSWAELVGVGESGKSPPAKVMPGQASSELSRSMW